MNKVRPAVINTAVSLSVALILSACGGGGSGDSPEPTAKSVSGVQFSGAAAKGIVDSGVVTAEELGAQGLVIAQVGSARTGIDGRYQLALSNDYSGGPIKVTISKDALTRMKCDVPAGCGNRNDDIADANNNGQIDFAEWYRPSALEMTAVVPAAASNDVISVNVTPFTHMAAEVLINSNDLSSTHVAQVNSQISNLIGGIDILNTQPIDITDFSSITNATATQVAYGALGSAIATLADVNTQGEPTIDAALQTLTNSFSANTMIADDSGSENDAALFSLQEIVAASQSTLTKMGMQDTSGVFATLTSKIENADDSDGDGLTDIEFQPSPTVGDTNLAKVKAMVSDVRTWGYVILENAKSPANAFADQMDMAEVSFKFIKDSHFYDYDLHIVANAVRQFIFENGGEDLTQYPIIINKVDTGAKFSSGTISSPEPGVIVIQDASIWADSRTSNFSLTIKLPEDDVSSSELKFQVENASFRDVSIDTAIDSGHIIFTLAEPYLFDWQAIENNTAPIPHITQVDIAMNGQFAQMLDVVTTYSDWPNIVNTNFSDPIMLVGELSTRLYVNSHINETSGEREYTWATPSNFIFDGVIKNTSGTNSFGATVTANITNAEDFAPVDDVYIESADNWLDADIGLLFTVSLDGVPQATVNITGNRTGYRTGEVDIAFNWDNRSLVVSASGDTSTNTFDGDITVSNQDGIKLVILPDQESKVGLITYNGNTYGSIYKTDSDLIKVSYIDGTFEIF